MIKLSEFKSQVEKYAIDCHDAISSTKSMMFHGRDVQFLSGSNQQLILGSVLEQGRLNDWAAMQIGAKLDAPGYDWLFNTKHCPETLQTTILNDLVTFRPEANVMVRSKGDMVRAVLSDQYTKFDNKELVNLAVTAIDTMGLEPEVKRVLIADDLSAYILFPSVTVSNDPRAKGGRDGQLHPAIHISNSERGSGSAKIAGAVFSGYCQNGMIYGWSASETMSIRHRYITSATMGALVADSIAIALNMSEQAAKAFVESQEIKISKVSLSSFVDRWASKYGLTVSDKESWLGAITGEVNRNDRPEDPRLFDVINGATWLAQEREVQDSVILERMSGDILAEYFPVERVYRE